MKKRINLIEPYSKGSKIVLFGYMKKNDEFDHALAHLSVLYADQNDIDYVKMQDII